MFYIILSIAIIILFVFLILKKVNKIKTRKIIQKLISSWGKSSNLKYKQDDFKYISKYFQNKSNSNDFYIDDTTWNDLDMESIFKKINRTISFVGESFLYYLLRKPEFKPEILESRHVIVDLFSKNETLRTDIQKSLLKLGRDRSINITDYLDFKTQGKVWKTVLYRLLSLFALISLSITSYDKELGIKLMLTAFIINLLVYHLAMLKIGTDLKVINNIANLINCCNEISIHDNPEIKEYTNKLKKLYKKVKSINNKTLSVAYNNNNELMQYVKIFLLTEIVNYNKITKFILKFKKEILEIYSILGEIDALISVASYRDSLKYYSIPKLSDTKDPFLNIENVYHPLINKPVSNSIHSTKSVLVTGSNASGKSTFLKSVAINAILAQTINISMSKSHESSYFKVLTSMALTDDISKGESYYIVEIKSIKRIIDNLNPYIPMLCFVDEVLRGTNTIERISASSKILEYLANDNCICFTATHDIELTSILKNDFNNYHFKEEFVDDKIFFDYKLYSGKSQTRNAIKLLKVIGFDDDIIKNAEKLSRNYELTGKW